MESSREQFTFYASFALALRRIRRTADRCAAYDAIVNYALYKTEPDLEKLPDAAAIAFDLIRPNLDASRKRAKSGKLGGCAEESAEITEANAKQSASKTEANAKQTASKKEKETEKENETETENEIETEKKKEDECLSVHPCRMPPPGGPAGSERSLRPLPELPPQSSWVPCNPRRPEPGDPQYMDKTIEAVRRWKAAGKIGHLDDYF